MKPTATVFAALALVIAAQARSDDSPAAPVCNSGLQSGWISPDALKKRLSAQAISVKEVKIVGDCYAVYAVSRIGEPVNNFYHPFTLKIVGPIPD